jgi:hypothetical protein
MLKMQLRGHHGVEAAHTKTNQYYYVLLEEAARANASSHFIILTSVRSVYGWRRWWTWCHVDRIMPVRRLYDVVSVEA